MIVNLPYNPNFDYTEWAQYRQEIYGDFAKWIWSIPDNQDYQRLPGNTNVFDLLLYIGKVFDEYLEQIGYTGENILYSPAYPDIIYTSRGIESYDENITNDSPHVKIPFNVSYSIIKRSPASVDAPFGRRKNWKFRQCGEFRDEDGNVWVLRTRWWENLVEFVNIARSGYEAEMLCLLFEHFMDLNEWRFLEAGLAKMAPFGRTREPAMKVENSGVHHRTTLFWFNTQEFQFAGPVTTISGIQLDVRDVNNLYSEDSE